MPSTPEPPVPDLDPNEPGSFPAGDQAKNLANRAGGVADGGATGLLGALLFTTPFINLYKAGTEQPRFRERLCFYVDFTIRIIAYFALLALACGVAWKTLAPFPSFWRN